MIASEQKLMRVLASGGMLIANNDSCRVYRSADARRGCAGVLSWETFERFKEGGDLVELQEEGGRWEWRAGRVLNLPIRTLPAASPRIPLLTQKVQGRSSTVLEAALKGSVDGQDKARMGAAAMRFLRDYERRAAGPSVTMNWSFGLGGHKRGYRTGMGGLPERSLSAVATLRRVEGELGDRQVALIECVLIKQHSQRRLCSDFGTNAASVLDELRQSLRQVAHIYDHKVQAEV